MPTVSARELLEAVPDAVVGVDARGRIVFVNTHAREMFGYEHDEIVHQPVELLLPDRLKERHREHRAAYHANPSTRPMGSGLNLLARRKDGSEFPVEISLSPLQTAAGLQVIGAIRDVTHRREHEIERERLLGAAEEARTQAEAALGSLAEAERLKDDLTNMVVHDLKNPVNGISMQVQLLLRRRQLSETQEGTLRQIDRTCRELLRLVGNVLEIAKIEAGQMPVAAEPILLAELVDEVALEYGPVAQELGRRLIIAVGTELPPAVADRALLKRVLVNLVVNALRHSTSTDVHVDGVAVPAAAAVVLRVVDHGRGIPAEDQAIVFEKFRSARGDVSADTGLGLPFCKLAVERMQGQIVLSSTPEAGTVFTVTLPCRQASA